MIISTKYKYLFIELPRTGTTSIHHELIKNYDGEEILSKHSTYRDFVKMDKYNEYDYFIFSCIRNPLERTVSFYSKIKNGYYDYKLNKKWYNRTIYENLYLLNILKYVKGSNCSYSDFLKKFYKVPYTDWSCLDHKNFDYIIRFENFNNNFLKFLKKIGVKPKRNLPVLNRTREKKNYLNYYTPQIYNHAINIFGPFMKEWDYTLPTEWGKFDVPIIFLLAYRFLKQIKKIYWLYLK